MSTNPGRPRPRIAILGGGITGLAAAHRLSELLPEADLALFEATNRLGGILDTVERDGFLLERSADAFQTKLPYAVDLCRRLGLADALLPTDDARRRALVVRSGRLVPVPAGFYLMSPTRLGPVLQSPVLSWSGKLRLLLEPLIPPARRSDESVASFATRRLGREVFERLVQPLVAGIYTGDAAQLSMAATLPEFLAYERHYASLLRATYGRFPNSNSITSARTGHYREPSEARSGIEVASHGSGARYAQFAAPPGGMTQLIAALAGRLPRGTVHLGAPLRSIRRHPSGGWLLEVDPSRAGPSTARSLAGVAFDAVLVAVPAHAAARLLEPADRGLATALGEIPYTSCSIVSVACRRAQVGHPLDGFGFVVPRVERRRILAASFASQKFPGRAPDDCVLIRVFVGGAHQPELADLPEVDLVRLARDELGDLVQLVGEPMWTDIARWPRSMPQYHVGHLERVALLGELAARHPGLALAGNAYDGVGIPQCIRSGEQAADRIAAYVSALSRIGGVRR